MKRDWGENLAVVIVGAITGAIAGTLLGGGFAVCVVLFCAVCTGDWDVKGMTFAALCMTGTFSLIGQPLGALVWFRFWTRRGRPPGLEEMGLVKVGGGDGLIVRAIRGTIIGAVGGVILGLILAASVLGALLGKYYFGPIVGVLGAEIIGMSFTSLFVVVIVLAGTKHRTGVVGHISSRIAGDPDKFQTFTRLLRGARHGAGLGAVAAGMIALIPLFSDLMTLLQGGMMMAVVMVLAGIFLGFTLGIFRDVFTTLHSLAKELKPPTPPVP